MIRLATLQDIPRLVELGALMHAESRYARLSFSREKVAAILQAVIERGAVFVAERDGEIIGGFAGVVEPHWFSTDLIATDLALFVEPGKRGGFAAAHLVDAFLDWAAQRGAVMTDILINTGIRTEDTARLFDRLGGKAAGLIYTWERN